MAAPRLVGPSVVKVRHPRPLATRVAALTRADDALWTLLFEGADIVSEGAAEYEGQNLVYRGTTSIVLDTTVLGSTQASQIAALARAASVDPHARLHAVRIARREAQVRAPGSLEPANMDLVVGWASDGVRIDVEVDARVLEAAAGAQRRR